MIIDELVDYPRVVSVDRKFYAKLMEYLLPTERWMSMDIGQRGLVLYAMPSKRLIFVPEDADVFAERD